MTFDQDLNPYGFGTLVHPSVPGIGTKILFSLHPDRIEQDHPGYGIAQVVTSVEYDASKAQPCYTCLVKVLEGIEKVELTNFYWIEDYYVIVLSDDEAVSAKRMLERYYRDKEK